MLEPRLNLKAAQGATNIVSFKDFAEIATGVLDRIIDTVLTVYGSKAMTVMLVPEIKGNQTSANIYTSDGINILKSMEFVNPLETHIADYVRYVGDRVEKRTGDGSSTAILLTCKLMKHILMNRVDLADENIEARLYLSSELQQNVIKFLDDLSISVEKLVVNLDDVSDEFRNNLLYKLCLITTKGEKHLSKTISEMYTYLPGTLRGTSLYTTSEYETDEKFITFSPDNDMYLTVYTSKRAILNSNLNTKIKHSNADVLLLPEIPEDPQIVLDFIEKRDSSNHLVIVMPTANVAVDNFIEGQLDHSKVTLCSRTATSQIHINNPIDIITVLAMAGKKFDGVINLDTMENDLCVKNLKIVIEDNELSMTGLYESINGLHPLFVDKSSKFYNEHEEELRTEIDELTMKGNKTDGSIQNLKVFLRLYRKLTCYKMPRIKIGGSQTEHLAALDVVNDATSAVSDVLDNGVVFDLLPKLQRAMGDRVDIKDLITVSYQLGHGKAKLRMIPEDLVVNNAMFFDKDNACWDEYPVGIIDSVDGAKEPEVVQSYNSIKTTIERIKESVVPLTKIDTVIVANSVYAEENK